MHEEIKEHNRDTINDLIYAWKPFIHIIHHEQHLHNNDDLLTLY